MLPLKNKTIKIAFITIRFPLEQFLNDNAILGSSIYALGPTPPAGAFAPDRSAAGWNRE